MSSFSWQRLAKPFWVLAPMEGVTDTVFRRVVASVGKPDVFFTEFTSADGLNSRGFEYVADRLVFSQDERPLIAQIWGVEPDNYYRAGKILVKMGFDGVDINMGCPDKAVIKAGAGSALINNRQLAIRVIEATKRGVAEKIPVSVKIRTGFSHHQTEEWAKFILDQGIAALTVHGRTTKQLSKVTADWGEICKVVQVRDSLKIDTVIVGNGDVKSVDQARGYAKRYRVDGIMFGRGILSNPWLFADRRDVPDKQEKLLLLQQHIRWFKKTWGERKPMVILRKYVKVYVDGFRGAKQLRIRLMQATSWCELEGVVAGVLRDALY